MCVCVCVLFRFDSTATIDVSDVVVVVVVVVVRCGPAHRKHKRLAPVCHAVVCSDCTLLPTPAELAPNEPAEPVYCVELKPKQGFLGHGHQRCPFCLNQYLKVPPMATRVRRPQGTPFRLS